MKYQATSFAILLPLVVSPVAAREFLPKISFVLLLSLAVPRAEYCPLVSFAIHLLHQVILLAEPSRSVADEFFASPDVLFGQLLARTDLQAPQSSVLPELVLVYLVF